ncbi:MAG TPA: hypothetical protein VIY54_13420 [Steroidobacteraceae bacterium]
MKSNRKWVLLIAAAASVGTGAAIAAAATAATTSTTTATTPTATAAGKHHWGHRGGMLVGITVRAVRQLNLSSEQQATIKGILSAARAQHQQNAAAGALDLSVLGNPGDPNYAAAIQNLKTRAAARLQSEMELQSQIYNVLLPAQRTQLPQVLASMQAQAAQRRAAWQQEHWAPTTGNSANDQ